MQPSREEVAAELIVFIRETVRELGERARVGLPEEVLRLVPRPRPLPEAVQAGDREAPLDGGRRDAAARGGARRGRARRALEAELPDPESEILLEGCRSPSTAADDMRRLLLAAIVAIAVAGGQANAASFNPDPVFPDGPICRGRPATRSSGSVRSASTLAGRHATVNCWSQRDWARLEEPGAERITSKPTSRG